MCKDSWRLVVASRGGESDVTWVIFDSDYLTKGSMGAEGSAKGVCEIEKFKLKICAKSINVQRLK